MPKSWSFANDRRLIELAKAGKSLEDAARIMGRTPKRIRIVSIRLGVSFKSKGEATSSGSKAKRSSPRNGVAG